MSGRLLFDQGPLAGGTLFRQPRDLIRADSIAEVAPALERVEDARASGLWVAGYLSYELGYALIPRLHHLMPEGRAAPLILMGVFDGPEAPPDLPRSRSASNLPSRSGRGRITMRRLRRCGAISRRATAIRST